MAEFRVSTGGSVSFQTPNYNTDYDDILPDFDPADLNPALLDDLTERHDPQFSEFGDEMDDIEANSDIFPAAPTFEVPKRRKREDDSLFFPTSPAN